MSVKYGRTATIERIFRNLKTSSAARIDGLTDPDEILTACWSDYQVCVTRLVAADTYGIPISAANGLVLFDVLTNPSITRAETPALPLGISSLVGGSHGIVRIDRDGSVTPFGTIGVQYTVTPNRELVEDAQKFLDHPESSAGLVAAGNEHDGRVFYVVLGLDPVVMANHVPPSSPVHSESFDVGIGLFTGHDGSLPFHTVFFIQDPLTGLIYERDEIRIKHFSKANERRRENINFLEYRVKERTTKFIEEVKYLGDMKLTDGSEALDRHIEVCVMAFSEIGKRRKEYVREEIRRLFLSASHAGTHGLNAWALFTAFVEFTAVEVGESVPGKPHRGYSPLPLLVKREKVAGIRSQVREALANVAP